MIVLDAALFMLALAFAASIVLAAWVEMARSPRQPQRLRLTLWAAVQSPGGSA